MSAHSTAGGPGPDDRGAGIRVLIVDDHAVMRAGLADMLEAEGDMVVVGECADGSEVAAAYETLLPDVVLMDVSMPRMDGLTATRLLVAAHPDAGVLVLTALGAAQQGAAVEAGARGFLPKGAPAEDLVRCLRLIAGGGDCWFEPLSA